MAERLELLAVAVEGEDGLGDRLEQEGADEVARDPAQHGADGADGREPDPLRAPGQHHRDEEEVGRDREDAALHERDAEEGRHGAAAAGERERPVVQPAQHP